MQTEQNKSTQVNVGVPPEGQIIQPTEVVEAKADTTEEPSGDQMEKVQQVKHSDFKRIKEEAKAKGKAEALSDLDAQAKLQGFTSFADALKALGELNKRPPAATAAKPASPTPPKEATTMTTKPPKKTDADKALEKARADAETARVDKIKAHRQWRAGEMKRREMQSALDAKDAEMGLREEMYRAGVADVDYTLRLLTRELEGMNEEQIAAYDRSAFYGTLRQERPYLFGEKVVPANTGTNGQKTDGSSPAEPKAGEASKEAAASNQFDARTAKPEDVQKRLRALGLNPHM